MTLVVIGGVVFALLILRGGARVVGHAPLPGGIRNAAPLRNLLLNTRTPAQEAQRAASLASDESGHELAIQVIDANREAFRPLNGFMKGAAGGALTGAALGPIGAAVGAVVGGVAGVVQQIIEQEHGEDLLRETIKSTLKANGMRADALSVDMFQHLALLSAYAGRVGVLVSPRGGKKAGEIAYLPSAQGSLSGDEITLSHWAGTYLSHNLLERNWRRANQILYGDTTAPPAGSAARTTARSKLYPIHFRVPGSTSRAVGVPYAKGFSMELRGAIADQSVYRVESLSGKDNPLLLLHATWLADRIGWTP